MFEHVTILLSFVFAIALTHLLSSTTELVWARDRVRFSGLQALWMANALLSIVVNWLSFWGLVAIKRWDVTEVELWFALAVVQYFTCSLISIRPKQGDVVDMPAFYERQRPAIFGAFAGLMLISMILNYWDRDHTQGIGPTDWINENLIVLAMLALILIAGWAKERWAQWAAGLVMFGLIVMFLSTYAIPTQ
jgi:peptidoglycan/LPS O-acetylase OafA/YrhL